MEPRKPNVAERAETGLPVQLLLRLLGEDPAGSDRSVARTPEEDPRLTTTDLESTSTSHERTSPASSPSTVATVCGTVVLRDSEPGAARNAFESNDFVMGRASWERETLLLNRGLSKGRRIDLKAKYPRQYRSIDKPMNGTRGPWDEATEIRAIQLVSSLKSNIRPDGRVSFRVKSSDGTNEYVVCVDADGWTCSCNAWTDRRTPCKHIVATVRWMDPNPAPILDEEMGPKRPSCAQPSWPKYDRAQQLEHEVFDRLLWDLLGTVPEIISKVGRRGRKSIPLRTQILMAVRKVHLNQSGRRARGLLVALNQDGKGVLPRVPNYSVPSRFFNKEFATPILLGLIELSGTVLRELETDEAVAIDSSGFSTSTMGSYYTEKYDPNRRHRFVKAHLAIGVKSHVVISAKITDEHGADCPQFDPLLRRLRDLGRFPGIVVADKAYLSRANLDLADSLGADPYIPYKVNSRALSKGSPMWNRKYYEFMLKRDEFDAIYHKRSNVESTFSAIKRKLGEPLLSKTELARLNELLGKVLAYNVGIVIKQATLLDLDPGPLGVKARDLVARLKDPGVPA